VARAKRTDRADARRRYRAATVPANPDSETGDAEPASGGREGRRAARGAQPARSNQGPAGRPSIVDSFRSALRPANIREDVAAAPAILRSSPLLWIPFGLVIVSGVVALIPGLGSYQIPIFLVQTFVFPPPLIGPFIAGLLAPRAGWLFGLLTGLVGAVMFALFAATTPGSNVAGAPPVAADVRTQYILYGLVTSPTFGALIGAFAGFYRRFLRSSSPQRANQNRSRRSNTRTRR
jgi:hypothetical protein